MTTIESIDLTGVTGGGGVNYKIINGVLHLAADASPKARALASAAVVTSRALGGAAIGALLAGGAYLTGMVSPTKP